MKIIRMEAIKKQILVQKFKDNQLTPAEVESMERAIAAGEIEMSEIENDKFTEMLNLPMKMEISPGMDARFYSMLENQKQKQQGKRVSLKILLRIAASLLLMLLAFGGGIYFAGSERQDPTTISMNDDLATSLLSTNTISDKIHLIASADLNDGSDLKIINALLFTLNHDESANVRLACIESLVDYAFLPDVREGLIQAIRNQSSPAVLSNLAEAIRLSGSGLSSDDFKEMINKELPPPILDALKNDLLKI